MFRKQISPPSRGSSAAYRMKLRRDDLWKFELRHGEIPIRCEQGSVWITREGSPRDVVLPAGRKFNVDGNGLVIVSAMTDAVVSVGD
jgi:uncharacterized protein (AIM24 family)